jgi:hypothetical protein
MQPDRRQNERRSIAYMIFKNRALERRNASDRRTGLWPRRTDNQLRWYVKNLREKEK